MDLYEYQARDLFEKYGVPVLPGLIADTPEEAKAAAEKLGGVVVVKAQVKTGGRGKAGGVKVAKNPDEAYEAAKAILGLDIKGHVVKRVMIAAGARIDKEYYFSVLLDRANRSYLSLASVEGGMEIEVLAVEKPEALARIEVDPLTGIDAAKALEIAKAANFDDELAPKVADVFVKLFEVYKGEDATLVEVNPLDPLGGRRDHRPRRQGLARRERRLPSRGPRAPRRQGCGRPARGEGQGERPQLRQARRRGGRHRKRCGPGHVDARRRRLRR